jgi:hypothetical protein
VSRNMPIKKMKKMNLNMMKRVRNMRLKKASA